MGKLIAWTIPLTAIGAYGPHWALTYALLIPVVIGIWPNVVQISPTTFVKQSTFVGFLVDSTWLGVC